MRWATVLARARCEVVLDAYERTLPTDHPSLLRARQELSRSMFELGEVAAARELLFAQGAGIQARIMASLALAPRQTRQTVDSEGYRLAWLHFLGEGGNSEHRTVVFELAETMRLVASEAARTLACFAEDPALAPILAEADVLRRSLGDLVGGGGQADSSPEQVAEELTRLSRERDRLERKASLLLAERGVVTRSVDAGSLADLLSEGEAVVGFRRLAHWHQAQAEGEIERGEDHLLAHVLRSDGVLTRIDLGLVRELEECASEWRAALGAPLLRGIGVEAPQADLEVSSGSRLRQRILDPILIAAGEGVERLFVSSDDLVYLLPLDALPNDAAANERLGDRVRIVNEVSFARLLESVAPEEGEPSLLAMGGVDYDADGAVPDDYAAVGAPIRGLDDDAEREETGGKRTSRGTMPTRFARLLQSRYEAEATAALFEEAFDIEAALLTLKSATKAELFDLAAGKRYVHIATHGWFAPESIKSTADHEPAADTFTRMTVEERITGFAPMTLCGLALAGANHGADSLGRVKGILTAEELCTLDLSQCELAVLSACETNVGIRRAGQGIQSLQSALYAAGARTSITSLWKVDDAATRRLMEVFYTNLWTLKMPKAEALWAAKCTMREEGHPPAHWAGWVMTGDPD